MNKMNIAVIAILLGFSAALGTAAATKTVGLGRAAAHRPSVNRSAIAVRAHRLDRIEAALRRSLRSRPPKLPPIPVVHRPAAPPAQLAAAPTAAAPQRLVYQRPPPIVVVKHRSHGDDHESDHGKGGGDD